MWAGRGEESEELKQYNLQGQKVSWEGKIVSFFLFFFLFSFFSFLRRERGDRERQRQTQSDGNAQASACAETVGHRVFRYQKMENER